LKVNIDSNVRNALLEQINHVGEFSLDKSELEEWLNFKRYREVIDSFQKQSFRSKFEEVVASFKYVRE
jgi:hypothetical protein